MFGDFTGGRQQLRQTAAEDLLFVVNRFAEDKAVANRTSNKAIVRVLEEQCEVNEEVEAKAKTGGDVMQNPSDPDVTYDGHKGPGQTQIAETCGDSNDVQLITGVDVEPPLSTGRCPILQAGKAAAQAICESDLKGQSPADIELGHETVWRGSTGPVCNEQAQE